MAPCIAFLHSATWTSIGTVSTSNSDSLSEKSKSDSAFSESHHLIVLLHENDEIVPLTLTQAAEPAAYPSRKGKLSGD